MRIRFSQLLATLLLGLPLAAAAAPTIDATIYTTKGERPLKLETATTPAAREQGLMHRADLSDDDGMLFVFPKAYDAAFWMKDTEIPLDMLFIGPDHLITHIEANAKPYSLNPRRAGSPTEAVIELDGGRAAKDGVAVGDMVHYALPKDMPVR